MKVPTITRLCLFLHLGSAVSVRTIYSSVLSNTSTSYCRVDPCSNGSYYYQALQITVNTAGNYTIRSNSTLDTFGYLYNNTFYQTHTSLNMLQFNDDRGGADQFLLSMYLQTMTTYIIVATTFRASVTGSFTIIVQGSAVVYISLDKCYRSVLTRYSTVTRADGTTVIGVWRGNVLSFLFVSLAFPAPAGSYYTSTLTSNSLMFCRTWSCPVNRFYYYQPIGFMTTTSGNYNIQSNSSLDTLGYIFNSTVHQITGVSGALMFDDDSGEDSQFLMTISVQAMFNYTLIVTTYAANMTGPFSVSASGDPPLTFFTLWDCSGKTEIDESLSCLCTVCWFAE